ncbi:bifunctional riboflavin kinase/FAD synthetase [Lucifera butyrica]|nr:bifunctional riboflavin kinase/FAD synthetase [Lucifera butyrica]
MTKLRGSFPAVSVALGTFDGIHLGHQKIISRVVNLARSSGGTSVVFTFSNHPLAVLAPEHCPPQIVSQQDKAALIEKLGVDVLLTIPFTREFLRLSPAAFITMLADNLGPRHVVVGPNYSFGYQGAGTPDVLQQAGRENSFSVEVHESVYVETMLVSSTLIRQCITEGNIRQATMLLGRLPCVTGTVIAGDQRGRTLGYPTANLAVDANLVLPADGVYAVRVNNQKNQYYGVANIGKNPTFQGSERRLEVYILDYTANLYGQVLTVEFVERIRSEIRFATTDELKRQIGQDVAAVRSYFNILSR